MKQAIVNAIIHTGDEIIDNGVIIIENGAILSVQNEIPNDIPSICRENILVPDL